MPTIEQFVLGLTGIASVAQAADARMQWWARVGYALVGADLVLKAYHGESFLPIRRVAPAMAGAVAAGAVGKIELPHSKLQMKFGNVHNIDQRVDRIHRQMIRGTKDPKIYELASKVLSRKCGGDWCVPEKDAMSEVHAMFQEVRSRVRYTLDPITFDAFQTPQKTLELKTGDCDDQVALLGALLMRIGYKVRSRVVHTKGYDTYNHIYLLVQLPNKQWMALDPTVNKPAGWEVPRDLMVRPPRDFDVVL